MSKKKKQINKDIISKSDWQGINTDRRQKRKQKRKDKNKYSKKQIEQ